MEWKNQVQSVVEQLWRSPGEIFQAMQEVQALKAEIADLQEEMKISEVNAELSAWDEVNGMEGKMLADEKKLRIQEAVQKDSACLDLRNKLRSAEVRLGEANARCERAKNVFAAARALEELLCSLISYSIYEGGKQ